MVELARRLSPARRRQACAPGGTTQVESYSSTISGPLRPARPAVGPDLPLPEVVRAATTRVIAVSQGTVDNADPTKLMIPALEALSSLPYVVVVTTGGKNTDGLRERFARPNVVIVDSINYDDLFNHVVPAL